MAEVNIQGIFGNRFLKKKFILNLKEGVPIKEVFSKIDSRLKIKFFKKNLKGLPDRIVILINGQPVRSPSESDISIENNDQISILRIIAGDKG
ncbi:MAG: MoaD/ThiS family protein [Desulfobacterales bacterium]|nr:MoaD/ThiS family protein [Desulfobacterales bacterium]